jgi:hypothetical protein
MRVIRRVQQLLDSLKVIIESHYVRARDGEGVRLKVVDVCLGPLLSLFSTREVREE